MNVVAETKLSSAESSRSSRQRTSFMISRELMDAANALTLTGLTDPKTERHLISGLSNFGSFARCCLCDVRRRIHAEFTLTAGR